jgi:hypothetical protein
MKLGDQREMVRGKSGDTRMRSEAPDALKPSAKEDAVERTKGAKCGKRIHRQGGGVKPRRLKDPGTQASPYIVQVAA